MADTLIQPALTCPACEGISFSSETRGRIFKSTVYQCRNCSTTLEAGKNDTYKVISVGEDYSNASTLLEGEKFKREQLSEPGLPIFSDNQLAEIANGTDPYLDKVIEDARLQ